MSNSLLTHEIIKTTLPKAKELRRVVEPMITLGKTATVANRRLAFNRLRDRDVVTKLFNELEANPGDYALAQRLSQGIAHAADAVTDPASRTSIKRCAAASIFPADTAQLRGCLAQLTAASQVR